MQLVHHGVTLQLPDDDPRVRVIETLLYGRPLPPPFPPPVPAQSPPAWPNTPGQAPLPGADVLPAPWRAFWGKLTPAARRWLAQLAAGPVPISDVRAQLGTSPLGLHRHIAGRARGAGLPMPVRATGRGSRRRWFLAPDALRPVEILAGAPMPARPP